LLLLLKISTFSRKGNKNYIVKIEGIEKPKLLLPFFLTFKKGRREGEGKNLFGNVFLGKETESNAFNKKMNFLGF